MQHPAGLACPPAAGGRPAGGHLAGRPDEGGAAGAGAGRDLVGELAALECACAQPDPPVGFFVLEDVHDRCSTAVGHAGARALGAGGEHAAPAGASSPASGRGRLWLKAEWLNPGGSVKDRAARAILRDGLARGELPGKRLLDASSGNTGIAYAMLGAAAGVRVTICLPGNASPERWALLKVYGAEVVVTDRMDGTEGAARRARELAERVARQVLLRRPVQQPRQSAGPPGDDGPRDLGPDRRPADPFRGRDGNHGNHDGHRALLEGEEPGDHPGRGAARLAVPRPGRAEALADDGAPARALRSDGARQGGGDPDRDGRPDRALARARIRASGRLVGRRGGGRGAGSCWAASPTRRWS